MDLFLLFALFAGVLVATLLSTRGVLQILRKRSVLDLPNERSSHTTPTPKGGGLAIVAILIPTWIIIDLVNAGGTTEIWLLGGGAMLLGAISWYDDLNGLSPILRLSSQLIAVTMVLNGAPFQGYYFAGLLPGVIDTFAAGFLWVWFINVFNFMDGIDGISGIEAACIGSGVTLLALTLNPGEELPPYAITIVGSALGFLWWNWHPAKIFMGDVGSVTLGFLSGWLLLTLSAQGQWAAAVILPLYYFGDATITLTRRALRGERVWQAHREHFYQQAVQKGLSHSTVVRIILAANSVLLALAMLSVFGFPLLAILYAFIVVFILLLFLGSGYTKAV